MSHKRKAGHPWRHQIGWLVSAAVLLILGRPPLAVDDSLESPTHGFIQVNYKLRGNLVISTIPKNT